MRIIFVRHGESMANVWHGAYDMSDSFNFLSLRGFKQAELAGLEIKEWLNGGHINHVISSEATRAKQTATVIMQAIGDDHWKRDYSSDDRLNEWCFGAPDQENWWEWESREHFVDKIDVFYNEVLRPALEANSNDTYLIVSHYYTMSYLTQKIKNPDGMSLDEKISYVNKDYSRKINNAQPYYFFGDMAEPKTLDYIDEHGINR